MNDDKAVRVVPYAPGTSMVAELPVGARFKPDTKPTVLRVMPDLGPHGCEGCISSALLDPESRWSCDCLPSCTNVVFVEDTPEGMAVYVLARMNKEAM